MDSIGFSDMTPTSRAATASAPGTAAANPARASAVGLDDTFLTLLIAQMRNQDPLSPQDPGKFVTDLVQLAQLEKQDRIARIGEQHSDQLANNLITTLGAQVGSQLSVLTVHVEIGDIRLTGGVVLEQASTSTTLVLEGADGVKHKVELGAKDAGRLAIDIDPQAQGLSPGRYKVSVSTEPEQAAPFELDGVLTEVAIVAGIVKARIAGAGDVDINQIVRFRGRADASTTPPTRSVQPGGRGAALPTPRSSSTHQVLS